MTDDLDHDDDDVTDPDGADQPTETTIDDMDHVGLLPNWERYGDQEQLHRFETLRHRGDLLQMMYGLEPATADAALFERASIERAKDTDLTCGAIDDDLMRRARVYVGCDPATSASVRASWFVAVVCVFIPATSTEPEMRIVADVIRAKGVARVEEQGRILQELYQDWQPEVLAVEAVGGFSYLATYSQHTLRLPVRPIVTGAQQRDEIPALAAELRAGIWHVPWSDTQSQRTMTPLIAELLDYPQGTTDVVMALSFCRRVHYETPVRRRESVRGEFIE
jgi:hypothetical protein